MNLREAVANLIKVKGRHNTEIAYQKLIEAFDADKPVFCGCGDQIMPDDGAECGTCVTARNAVKPEQEPVAWFMEGTFEDGTPSFTQVCETDPEFYVPLYTTPPQREWQRLTDEEVHNTEGYEEDRKLYRFARAIEAKLKEKNT